MDKVILNKLSIQNFKAFGEMVDIPIRPITLIFGENSAGKSSILHSLLFLHQMKYQPYSQIADITLTTAGGKSVDLGGISRLKHNHLATNALHFVIETKLDSHIYSIDIEFTPENSIRHIQYSINQQPILKLHSFTSNVQQFDLRYSVDIWPEVIDYLASLGEANSLLTTTINALSPTKIKQIFEKYTWSQLCEFMQTAFEIDVDYTRTMRVTQKNHVFPSDILFKSHQVNRQNNSISLTLINSKHYRNAIDTSSNDELDMSTCRRIFEIVLRELLEYLDTITKYTFSQISELSYTGPIRVIPTRNFDIEDQLHKDASTGGAAWDELVVNEYIRKQVNNWLTVFGTNKQITAEQLVDLARIRHIIAEQKTVSQMTAALNAIPTRNILRFYDPSKQINLSHRDLGVGVSQVIPVIVNCLIHVEKPILIEQPELHLHPRLQGDLADLFIDTAIKGDQHNTYIIETHSEHIIRRLMRRIREDRHKSADETRITKDDVAILYVANGPNGSTVTHLRLDDEGDLIDEWPNGFFEESFRDDMAGR